MKILMVGDIVGEPGRKIFAGTVKKFREEGLVDFVVANGENAAGGKGITGAIAEELLSAGADVITLGDHTWDRREVVNYLQTSENVIRPANFPPGSAGKGFITVDSAWGPVMVINLIGRVFMQSHDCPYRTVDSILENHRGLGSVVIVDIHAEATSEKVVMGRYLDGRVSCVAGTHTHVQTSDEQVLPGGTGYITDLGMTGPKDSAIGRDLKSVTSMLLTGMPHHFKVATGNVMLEGVIVDVDPETGRASGIKRVREKLQKDD